MATVQLQPVCLGLEPSFGFGDRLGLATPGHLAALRESGGGIRGIFAQQSIREMTRTRRTAAEVIAAAANALQSSSFQDPWGADADHLKTPDDVEVTAREGFVFFTIDPSDFVDPGADNYSPDQLHEKYQLVAQDCPWVDSYLGKTVAINDTVRIQLDRTTLIRAAVKYGQAIVQSLQLAAHIEKVCRALGMEYEVEISVDETPQPTTNAEHFIIAEQLLDANVPLVSLAPRFVGDFEKGVDFKGNLDELESSLAAHAAIAERLGPYKLSLHSGSDKLSMYGILARTTQGRFHVKTAGTSYLEALRVVLRHDASLFRAIVDFSRTRYETDKATYHVAATLADAPAPDQVSDDGELERLYLECWADVPEGNGFTAPGRQILHCTFGSVLTHDKYGVAIHELLKAHPDSHEEILAEHFGRHLDALRKGL